MKEFIHYDEHDFFAPSRKEKRLESKLASKLDRSKYKKTDQDKVQKVEPTTYYKKGIVTRIHSQEIIVDCDGKLEVCTLRGILKKDRQRMKNLVIVGDIVSIDDNSQAIAAIDPRKSVLSRADNLSQNKEHLIAANVDQVLITVAVVDPSLRPSIIDRYLIAATKGGLTPIIICNKFDLLEDRAYLAEDREKEKELLEECTSIYTRIGIPFIPVSATSGEGMDRIRTIMQGRISVFSGQSGTGKSSLINALCGLDLKVGRTVQSSRKGAHTTSYAELIKLPFS
ncbi:MAG: rsgA, partial [Chlamydiia bacterium]|nr:rsgA [Chlamydiia bacterium]